ncbi:MAG: hypothetical protein QF847_00170 [Candidatus Marinimicrobia bacterium]|jgi:hypothetical protein|nr:hypothetical protein [Candidatus Neomarinimicrobiota bacterium]MDP5957771.1 hypothetical protein [Candidatus Neomarinimicrobiota bacterium]MDP6230144.1 hypothetical protein [Candidatus Neomarinimicrobiota bacterium]MDP6610717.1 hypothetical protein [Candidatus Neomarinimicrobiota bacterium]MDP6725647.1 hypothetical protein [Candidatus Neomarinimicrobiota bacterium]|tara:strand:+ start:1828 stop:2364 length:537 start_codon:yes stop_codon:yes gene_type:complete
MIIAATVFMALFGVMGILDGVYYHDYKYKLAKDKESIVEHIVHTFRNVAFPIIVYYLFQHDVGGKIMMIGVTVAIIDIILLAIDVRIEGYSRNRYGGLSNGEYATHIFANTFHYVSIALILAAKPEEAWTFTHSYELIRPYPEITVWLGSAFVSGGSISAIWHFWQWSQFVTKKRGSS